MSLCKNPTSWIASMPFSIWYPSLQCINLHKLFFAPRSCLKCKSSFIKDVIFCLRNRTKCTERGSRGFSRNKLTRSKISSISWISSIYYKDFNNNPPESGGEREGSPGLGSPQLRQVLGLELHHHVVKPGGKIFQPKIIKFFCPPPVVPATPNESANMFSPWNVEILSFSFLWRFSQALAGHISSPCPID